MHGWVGELGAGQRVLDLGAGAGSLKGFELQAQLVCVDCDPGAFSAPFPGSRPVVASAERLPFPAESFDLVICHHALEHIPGVDGTLREIGRVLKRDGRLYISVPNGYGLCDGIYRYVFEGGDHVNRFRKAELVARVERTAGVHLRQWQKLYSSFAYLYRLGDLDRAIVPTLQPRLRRIARLPARLTRAVQAGLYVATRAADRAFGVDWSLYGWALYFERGGGEVTENRPFVNVCLNCGSGHAAEELERSRGMFYLCPSCRRRGIYFPPFRNGL